MEMSKETIGERPQQNADDGPQMEECKEAVNEESKVDAAEVSSDLVHSPDEETLDIPSKSTRSIDVQTDLCYCSWEFLSSSLCSTSYTENVKLDVKQLQEHLKCLLSLFLELYLNSNVDLIVDDETFPNGAQTASAGGADDGLSLEEVLEICRGSELHQTDEVEQLSATSDCKSLTPIPGEIEEVEEKGKEETSPELDVPEIRSEMEIITFSDCSSDSEEGNGDIEEIEDDSPTPGKRKCLRRSVKSAAVYRISSSSSSDEYEDETWTKRQKTESSAVEEETKQDDKQIVSSNTDCEGELQTCDIDLNSEVDKIIRASSIAFKNQWVKSKSMVKCKLCTYSSFCVSMLKRHSVIHYTDDVNICAVCQTSFKTKVCLQEHLLEHAKPEEMLQCIHCSYTNESIRKMIQHTGSLHRTTINGEPLGDDSFCPKCNLVVIGGHKMIRHLNTHLKNKPFVCELCPYSASTKGQLVKHLLERHGIDKRQRFKTPLTHYFKCGWCGYKFTDMKYFRIHLKEFKTQCRRFKCNVCSLVFLDVKDVLEHQAKRQHDEKVTCRGCGKKLNGEKELLKHINTEHHSNEPEFVRT